MLKNLVYGTLAGGIGFAGTVLIHNIKLNMNKDKSISEKQQQEFINFWYVIAK